MPRSNPWFSAVEQTLPEYVPLPMQELFQAGQIIQERQDRNLQEMADIETGLASIEARLPGHKDYVRNLSAGFRNESSELLDRFGGNATDPQFQREFSRLRSKYANDSNLSTILMANEAAKRNDEIAANLAAQGKLFVNPKGTGVDAEGNLINDVGQVRGVNTLDNLAKRLRDAMGSTTEVGDLITNRPAIEQTQKEILQSLADGSPEFMDLRQAYMDQGLSASQADNQVAQDVQRMFGEYAIQERTNWDKKKFEANERQRKLDNAIRAAKLREENIKNGTETGPPPKFRSSGVLRDSGGFETVDLGNGQVERVKIQEFIPERIEDVLNTDIKVPVFGNDTSYGQTGSQQPVNKGQHITGKIHVIEDNRLNNKNKTSNSFTFEDDGVSLGFEAPFVITEGPNKGKILSVDDSWSSGKGPIADALFGKGKMDGTSTSSKIFRDSKGYYVMDEKGRQDVAPRAMEKYSVGNKVVWRELNHDQTIYHFGPEFSSLSGSRPSVSADDRSTDVYKYFESAYPSLPKTHIDVLYNDYRDEVIFRQQNENRGKPKTEPSYTSILSGGR